MPLYPDAPRLDLVDDLHGRPVPDPYRWLESGDAGDDALRSEWSAQQAGLYDAEAATWTTTEHWRARVGDLLKAGGVGPPAHRGDRAFFMRREPDGDMAVLWTIDPDGTERVLIDPMQLDPDGHTTLDALQPSKEGHLLAYQLSVGGTEEPDLFVMDVATGEQLEGPIDRVRYSPIAWLPGAEAYYYVRRLDPSLVPENERHFHRRVYLHRLGADPGTDVEIFGAGRTITNYYGVSVSIDGRWLQVSSQEGTEPRNDLWIADLTASPLEAPELVPVQVDVDAQTGLSFGRDGRFYVHTDRDAPMGRLAVVDPATPTADHWVDLLPEDPAAVLEDFAVLDGPDMPEPRLLAAWSRHGVGEMTLHDLATGEKLDDVDLPGVGTLGGIVEQPDGGPVMWFVYTDYTTQSNVYTYDGRTGAVALYASPPGHVDVPTVFTRQETYTSKDGTAVRMFVLSPSDGPDRPRPTLLYGYGGFGIAYAAGVLVDVARLGRGRWRVRRRLPPRRRRGGRGVAPRRHAGQQAERVRRLPRRAGAPDRDRPHHARAARGDRRQQRRPAHGRRRHAAARSRAHRRLRGTAARHGALHDLPARTELDGRVRRPRGARRARLAAVVLAVPQRA